MHEKGSSFIVSCTIVVVRQSAHVVCRATITLLGRADAFSSLQVVAACSISFVVLSYSML